jgi:predicted phosphohydrolase
LKSYWHTSRNRLNDNVASIVDLQLLKGASELIEQDLISLAQQWSCTDEMADILSERPESFYQRQVLKKKEEKVRAAIDKIKNFRIY